jgi:hypothetical protein
MDCLGTCGSGALFAPVIWTLADKKLKGTAVMRLLQGRVASRNFLTACLTRILTVGADSSVQSSAGIRGSSVVSHIVLAQPSLTPKALEAQT